MFDVKLAAVDAIGILLDMYTFVAQLASAVFTVLWDPAGISARPIEVCGRSVRVVFAPTERERRVVSWFYRWHDAADLDDWCRCVARFRLRRVPDHALFADDGLRCMVSVDLDSGTHTISTPMRIVRDGRVPLGGLTLEFILRDAARAPT